MARKNTLFITHDGMTDPLGQSQVIPYLQGLSKLYNVTIISCEKPDRFQKNQQALQQLLSESNIQWIPIPYRNKPPFVSTFFMLREMYQTALKIHRNTPLSLVHCRSTLSAFVGRKLKRNHSIKMIFDIRGFWADERLEGNLWNIKNPLYAAIYRFMKASEKSFYKEANHVVCLTNASANIVQQQFGIDSQHISVIPCAADLNLFSVQAKVDKQTALQKLDMPQSAKVLCYLGSIGTGYLLDEMLRFYKVGASKIPDLYFLFISPDSMHLEILQQAERMGIATDKIKTTFVQRNQLPFALSAVDYSVFFYKPTFSRAATSPTKHGELTALHIPCVSNKGVGDMEAIMAEEKTGIVVDDLTEAGYAKAWTELINLNSSASSFDKTAAKYYSLDKGRESYAFVYNKYVN